MALSYKARKRLSLLILLIAMPVYVIVAVNVVGFFDRPSILVELLIYVSLGIVWVLPFKSIFKGVGQADPEAKD